MTVQEIAMLLPLFTASDTIPLLISILQPLTELTFTVITEQQPRPFLKMKPFSVFIECGRSSNSTLNRSSVVLWYTIEAYPLFNGT
jgi:hypothetical protein